MHLKATVLISFFFPVLVMAQEAEIRTEYNSYLEDFMAFDFEGLATHFTTPVTVSYTHLTLPTKRIV